MTDDDINDPPNGAEKQGQARRENKETIRGHAPQLVTRGGWNGLKETRGLGGGPAFRGGEKKKREETNLKDKPAD